MLLELIYNCRMAYYPVCHIINGLCRLHILTAYKHLEVIGNELEYQSI